MPGGTQETVTNTTSKPYPGSRKLINTALKDAFGLYNNNVGGGVYTGSLVVPRSKQETEAYGNLSQIANRNSNGRGLQGNMQDIINNGGFSDYQKGSLGSMRRQLSGLGADGLTNAQDDAMSNYRSLANSSFDMNANPGAQGVLDTILRKQSDAANLNAAASGRYGSGSHEGVLAREAGDTTNQFVSGQYNNWLGRRDAANSAMAGLGQQGFQNREGLAASMFNAGQAGLGNMTSAYQGLQAPEQTRMQLGAMDSDLYKRTIDDQMRIYDGQQNAGWNQIGKLLNVANLQGMYKDTTGTTIAPGPNPFLQTLGGVSTGVGLLGTLGLL